MDLDFSQLPHGFLNNVGAVVRLFFSSATLLTPKVVHKAGLKRIYSIHFAQIYSQLQQFRNAIRQNRHIREPCWPTSVEDTILRNS